MRGYEKRAVRGKSDEHRPSVGPLVQDDASECDVADPWPVHLSKVSAGARDSMGSSRTGSGAGCNRRRTGHVDFVFNNGDG